MPVYEGSEKYIFVSYAHLDNEIVLPIIAGMQARGFRVWYDRGIEAGTEWSNTIAKHVANCECFVSFMSQNAADSENCLDEIAYAKKLKKTAWLVMLDDETVLPEGLEMQTNRFQRLFRSRHPNEESFIDALCRAQLLQPCRDEVSSEQSTAEAERKAGKEAAHPSRPPHINAAAAEAERKVGEEAARQKEPEKDFRIENGVLKKYIGTKPVVEIPACVTSIGPWAFRDCKSLTSITIPDSVTSIGPWAFCDCNSLTSIAIPDSVTSIEARTFSGCNSLTSITIPNSVTSIGEHAFEGCNSLTSITIPSSVTSIGFWAFKGCESLTSITIPNSVTSIGEGAFYCCSSLTSITIPNSVTSIDWFAFKGCESLTSITIPNSVTSIGTWAFEDCKSLTSITIPKMFRCKEKDMGIPKKCKVTYI